MYIDIKGKIERGEKLKQITAEQLIRKYWKLLEGKVSVVPMTGITPDHFKVTKYHLRTWREYLTELGLIEQLINCPYPYTKLWYMVTKETQTNLEA